MSIEFRLQFFNDEPTAEGTETVTTTGEADTSANTGNPEPTEGQQTLKELLKSNPSYKQEYDDMFNKAFTKRMSKRDKELETLNNSNAEMKKVLEMANYRYGIDPNSATFNTDLLNAMQNDATLLEEQASAMGMDTQSYLRVKQAEQVIAQQNKDREDQERQAEYNKVLNGIFDRCDKVKAKYPSFDFNAEMENEQFFRLVAPFEHGGSNVDPLIAYEVMHPEMREMAINQQVNNVALNTTKAMNNNLSRPIENGVSNGSPSILKVDPKNFTMKDIEEVKERLARGERVTFE